ncbi:MAG: hypothetical protein QOF72_1440 [Blastocatellia bacterium]|jgi:hypothetical protein|nr:hypothetical protein [Blastocatellia bacterium]
MKHTAQSQPNSASDTAKPEVETGDRDAGLPANTTGVADARSTSDSEQRGEGSVGYRIAAMVAMFLLALVTIVIWYFGR